MYVSPTVSCTSSKSSPLHALEKSTLGDRAGGVNSPPVYNHFIFGILHMMYGDCVAWKVDEFFVRTVDDCRIELASLRRTLPTDHSVPGYTNGEQNGDALEGEPHRGNDSWSRELWTTGGNLLAYTWGISQCTY